MDPQNDVMTYDAQTGEITYRAFTDEERAENDALAEKEITTP